MANIKTDKKTDNKSDINTAKQEAADTAIKQIKGKFGEGAIMKFGESRRSDVDVIPTGCLSLDIALGILGVPRGRVIEIFGPEASGKTEEKFDASLYKAGEEWKYKSSTGKEGVVVIKGKNKKGEVIVTQKGKGGTGWPVSKPGRLISKV